MSPEDTAAAVKDDIGRLGGAFMLSEQAKAASTSAGIGGWAMYMIGRGGVLGDVHPDVVTSAFYFLPASSVHKGWVKGRAALTPPGAVSLFTGACHEWGRRHLAGVTDAERLAELLARVAAAADVAGLPLFAGWRAVPLANDPPARLAQLCHVLREYRGGVHGLCCVASGLSPLEAVLTSGGESGARFFAWPEPYDDVTHLLDARKQAEALTDQRAASPWGVLDEDERAEGTSLLAAARQVAETSLGT
ncbi:MAG TPA: hypothetical protein VNB94_08420 [Mycobacteriales bacterium]|nr:hypothetical protein [Mycobacteriales bacterium]